MVIAGIEAEVDGVVAGTTAVGKYEGVKSIMEAEKEVAVAAEEIRLL